MYGTNNALNELCVNEFLTKVKDEGYFKITTQSKNLIVQTILKTAIIQLETMHISYANYIKIKKMEV